MITINNAKVHLFDHNGKVAFMSIKSEDQDLETLKALGRGKYFGSILGTLSTTYKGNNIYIENY